MQKVATLILGAPRSGTSLISHVIHGLGFYFGEHHRFVDPVVHPWNPKFFELQSLNDLNDRIIRSYGHEYLDADWLPIQDDFDQERIARHKAGILDFIHAEFKESARIGLKDPRFCLTLPIWMLVLREAGYAIKLVWVARHLASCLRSNKLADASSPMRPERLVVSSCLSAAYFLADQDYYFCNYDAFFGQPEESVRQLCRWLDAAPENIAAACSVIQPALRHNLIADDEELSPALAKLSALLLAHQLKAEHYLALRELLSSYGYLSLFQEKNKWLAALRRVIHEKDAYLAGLMETLPAQHAQVVAESNGAAASQEEQIDELSRAMMAGDAQLEELSDAVSSKELEIAALSRAMLSKDGQIADLRETIASKEACIQALDARVQHIQASTSWKITGPMRHVRRWLRQGKNSVQALRERLRSQTPDAAILRAFLVRRGHRFYKSHLKGTRFGTWLGNQLLQRGIISSAELQISALSADTRRVEQTAVDGPAPKNHPATHAEAETTVPGFHLSPPLNLEIADRLARHPRINVLLPSLRLKHMSGGPNTALLFAAILAEKGEQIRLIACDAPAEGEETAVYAHMDALLQRPVARDRIALVDAFDRTHPTCIGANDVFFATAWWTAQLAKYATRKTLHRTFIYLIQDFEPILHEGSSFQARALETYGLPHIPLINSRLLMDHLVKEAVGQYAGKDFAAAALAFEPALDRNYYFPDPENMGQSGKKVLLFYARPTVARRNLFEIGVVALRQAVASGAIDRDRWEVWAMGEKLPPVALGNGVYLNPLPWMRFDDYAKRVRTADLLLSLMLSPHPSYPPLEMAASGKLVVTNSFSVKTAGRMQALSPNIIVAEPTADGIGAALENAAGRINARLPSHDPSGTIDLPKTWDESLQAIVPALLRRIDTLRFTPPSAAETASFPGYPATPSTEYERYRIRRLAQRRREGTYQQSPGLLSFVTSAYNTAPEFLVALGNSLFVQDGGMHFEWLILDNGSTEDATRAALQVLARYPGARLERVEDNLGIIGGMRYLLERANGRYILPLDSDDLVEPDCVNVLTRFIQENDYPALLYTDEDKMNDDRFGSPYFKPGWDPVLFMHSCYIAHLCAIDREKALALGLYSDKSSEGCHDWDSFLRFMNAGYLPRHVPEVLYSWRIHQGSTSGNIASKAYITDSHRATLARALQQRKAKNLVLEASPLFQYNVDWRFRRTRDVPVSCHSLAIGDGDLAQLVQQVSAADSEFVHLVWYGVVPDDGEWRWEAAGLFELFPDAVMVGGAIHDGTSVIGGPCLFGFGDGVDCPDRGRALSDPGCAAGMHKARSVSAVSIGHCVVTRAFLLAMSPVLLAENVPLNLLAPWLGALAAEAGKRVVYSPFMRAKAASTPESQAQGPARAHFLSRFLPLLPDIRYYSEKLGLWQESAYRQVPAKARHQHVQTLQLKTQTYVEWLAWHLKRRAKLYPLPEKPVSFSLITTVYEHTKLDLLDLLAASVVNQSLQASEWIIVAHGPIAPRSLTHIQARAFAAWGAKVIVEPSPLGIAGAMRVGLAAARCDYIVPLDADDLITPDALQILANAIDHRDRPDLVYSDEDLLIDGVPTHPYLRPAFDPILHLDSSYVWHLCAIHRARALALALYDDPAATWCHDWDTLTRIANADGRIEHVPEVLYHWRQHAGSTTNHAAGDPRSLASVRHILQRQIARTPQPERYVVADWPVNRGSRELYIARKSTDLPAFVWSKDAAGLAWQASNRDQILVVAAKGISVASEQTYLEVARLFELHPRLGAIGGLVTDHDDVVVDACGVLNERGEMESPWLGMRTCYTGPYALALKPQSVAVTGRAFALFSVAALASAGIPPGAVDTAEVDVNAICSAMRGTGWRIGFSPLVRAQAGDAFRPEWLSLPAAPAPATATNGLVRYGRTLRYRT